MQDSRGGDTWSPVEGVHRHYKQNSPSDWSCEDMKIKQDCGHGSKDGKAHSELGEKGAVPPNRLRGLGGSYRSGRCDVSNCGTENNGLWLRPGGEGMGLRQWAGRHQLWPVNPHFHYRGDQHDRGPNGSTRWCCSRGRRRGTKHSIGTQAGDKRGLMKGLRGPIGSQWGKGLTGICRSSSG